MCSDTTLDISRKVSNYPGETETAVPKRLREEKVKDPPLQGGFFFCAQFNGAGSHAKKGQGIGNCGDPLARPLLPPVG